jgi:hypothetical protein
MGAMLDIMLAMVGRAFTMWIYRGQKQSLTDQANLHVQLDLAGHLPSSGDGKILKAEV